MRICAHCRIVIRQHVWVFDNRDFCGKSCLCRYQQHPVQWDKARKKPKPFCDDCRGPLIQGPPRPYRGKRR